MLTLILLALSALCHSALVGEVVSAWLEILGWKGTMVGQCQASVGRVPGLSHSTVGSSHSQAYRSFQFYLIFSNCFSVLTRNACQLF